MQLVPLGQGRQLPPGPKPPLGIYGHDEGDLEGEIVDQGMRVSIAIALEGEIEPGVADGLQDPWVHLVDVGQEVVDGVHLRGLVEDGLAGLGDYLDHLAPAVEQRKPGDVRAVNLLAQEHPLVAGGQDDVIGGDVLQVNLLVPPIGVVDLGDAVDELPRVLPVHGLNEKRPQPVVPLHAHPGRHLAPLGAYEVVGADVA